MVKRKERKNEEMAKKIFYGGCIAVGAFFIGWGVHIWTETKIPYSYRTNNPMLDILSAIGLRDYADI